MTMILKVPAPENMKIPGLSNNVKVFMRMDIGFSTLFLLLMINIKEMNTMRTPFLLMKLTFMNL